MSSERGQITIFFSTTILVLITFMAFIINIGVFVKAKINLQNATDAAAYAGASVQARQLTNISYMNWEMRNVFKEWMFKYYVLGGLSLRDVANGPSGGNTNFRMESYQTSASFVGTDSYNFPSVCIDFAGTNAVGICTKYLLPGLPRFKESNVIAMDETTNAFFDTIISEKAKDCANRTQINYLTASNWAYNVTNATTTLTNLNAIAPQVGTNDMGAFPAAFDLGLRLRSLEAQVNYPPHRDGVCINQGVGVNCAQEIEAVNTTNQSASTERVYKAFYSGFRNLGSEQDDIMRKSFTLTEIAPESFKDSAFGSLSNLLIPSDSRARTKYYLDLKLMTINYATFFTSFTPTQQEDGFDGNSVTQADSEGQCAATKIGLPVPGYPLGYVKNPDVLTYYAVRGQSKFVGLFNPFENEITLTAFSAAKPFGGRIGPSTFSIKRDVSRVFPRGSQHLKSSSFVSGLDTSAFKNQYGQNIAPNTYDVGAPLPLSLGGSKFWLKNSSDAIGGWVTGSQIFFGIPNITYDYPNSNGIFQKGDYFAAQDIEQIIPGPAPDSLRAGLYNKQMFNKFRANLNGIGGIVSVDNIKDAILSVRAPTHYDAANYLVPTPERVNAEVNVDAYGAILGSPSRTIKRGSENLDVYKLRLYAPIISPNSSDALYKNVNELRSVLSDYLGKQEPAIKKYVASMNTAASTIFKGNISRQTNQNTGAEAARAISDLADAVLSSTDNSTIQNAVPTCNSITGKFAHFYLGQSSGDLGIANCSGQYTTITELLTTYWTENISSVGQYYEGKYVFPQSMKKKIYSAYRPGIGQGSPSDDGDWTNFINKKTQKMYRNSYSTKFISLGSVTTSNEAHFGNKNFPIMSEGATSSSVDDINQSNYENPLDTSSLKQDINTIKH